MSLSDDEEPSVAVAVGENTTCLTGEDEADERVVTADMRGLKGIGSESGN